MDESIAGTIGTMRAMRGMADDSIPAVVQVSPAQPAAATALSGDWWNQPGLLPTSPQGTIASTGRDPSGNCRVTLNGAPLVSVAPGSIILPDTTRAFAILADCKAEPLITLPLEQNPNTGTTIAGGSGPRNPVRVVPGQSENVQPASFAAALYPTPAVAMRSLVLLGGAALSATPPGWLLLGTVAFYTGAITYTVWDVKQANQLSSTEIGNLALTSFNTVMNSNEIAAGIERNASSGTERANRLQPPGDCNQNQYNELVRKKTQACPRVMLGCEGVTDPAIRAARAAAFVACAKAREEINQICFDGGSDTHKIATKSAWEAARNCLN